jgi:hypothetical protein
LGGTLYIIGNGFDLHHRIPSSYQQFGAFLKVRDKETFEFVERYFDVNSDFWWEFEGRLAYFDSDQLIDDASNFLVGYGADDWSDAYHHDYQYEVNRAVEAISKTMRSRFGDWIRQLSMPDPSEVVQLLLPLDRSANFLNFNYTPSLQHIYGVSDDRILHIHGSVADTQAHLVLGHGWRPPDNLDPYRFYSEPEDADMRVVEGQEIVDDYFKETFKPTERIIQEHQPFFVSLAGVENILVMGHSLSEVDHPYFHEVIRRVDPDLVKWRVSYYGDIQGPRDGLEELGVDPNAVQYLLLTDRERWG